ncbi:MAG: hypothetical protein IPO72_18330 [Saprospiraceae bacterium]|nr:hypothetical protein [Candidatus Vicinibacter affinis]
MNSKHVFYASIAFFGKRLTLILFIFLSLNLVVSGQVTISGGSNVNGPYATVAAAVSALNGATISGPVMVSVTAGHSETVPAGGIELTATGTAVNTITFFKSGMGANPLLTAYVNGAGTPGTAVQDGIFRLVGSDYVTIDGINLTENPLNITNPSTMEYGFGLFKQSVSNGCQFNTIKNCVITLSYINNASGTLPAVEGSRGIDVLNSTPTATTTSLVPTLSSGTNSNNKFYTNTISNCNYGIVLSGYAASSPFNLGDTLNDVGGNSAMTGNTIFNYGGAPGATNPSAGIRAINQWGVNISFNTINNNNGAHFNHISTFRGIYAQSGTSASATINNNNVTLNGGATTSQLAFIENGIGSTPAGNTVNINNNTLTGNYLTATSASCFGIYNFGATPSILNIMNNTVKDINYSDLALTGSGTLYLIYNTSSIANMAVNIINNTVKNIKRFGTSGGTTIGVYNSSGVTGMAVTVKKNVVDSMSIDGAGTTSTMYGIQTVLGTILVDSNTVSNLRCLKTTGSSALYGIYNISTPVNENYNYNNVINLIHSGTGITYGIYTNTATGVRTVSNNLISNISTFGTTVGGIYQLSSAPTIFNNKVYEVISYSSGAPTVFGIMIGSTGTANNANVYNNLIGNLKAPLANTSAATSPTLRGINLTTTSTTTTLNVSYNTIYLDAQSTGANFGTCGLFATTSATATSATLNLNNNNIVNLSNPRGTGKTTAYQRSSTTLTNYGTGSNRNNFYAGGSCINRLIFFDGTNADSVLADFKTRVSTREANSISESPNFLSTLGSNANFLHIDPAKPTSLESGGAAVAGITTDFDGNTRNATTPDIGADEFTGTVATACSGQPVAGTITANPNPLCSNGITTICVSGQSTGSGLTYQWKSSNAPGGPFADIPCAKDKCFTTDPLATGTYYYKLIVTCPASGMSDSTAVLIVTVNSSPIASITPLNSFSCESVPVTLTASGGINYLWNTGAIHHP